MPRSNHKSSLTNNNTKSSLVNTQINFLHQTHSSTKSGVLLFFYTFLYLYTYHTIYLVTPPNPLAHPQPPHPTPPTATLKPRNPHPQFFTLKSAFLNKKSTNHHHPPHYTLSRWTLERVWAPEKSGNPRWQAQPQQAILEPTTTKHTGQQRREHTRYYFITCCPILWLVFNPYVINYQNRKKYWSPRITTWLAAG